MSLRKIWFLIAQLVLVSCVVHAEVLKAKNLTEKAQDSPKNVNVNKTLSSDVEIKKTVNKNALHPKPSKVINIILPPIKPPEKKAAKMITPKL